MTTTTKTQEIAAEAAACFETAQRQPNGDEYVRVRDGSPEWITDLVRAAHGTYIDGTPAFLPDDWRYRTIAAALDWIANSDSDDLDDEAHAFADDTVDVYTGRLIDWLGSNLQRIGYCDEAADEYGGEPASITDRIALGQYAEAREVFALVLEGVQARAARAAIGGRFK